jgi:hypothetical protein
MIFGLWPGHFEMKLPSASYCCSPRFTKVSFGHPFDYADMSKSWRMQPSGRPNEFLILT